MIYFDKQEIRDKIKACWIGKNIGGTIGGPYEGKTDIMDVKGFKTEAGTPLPNDDLDLQLVWLQALCEQGPQNINSKVLGEYWLSYIGPCWNEYGVCKANMQDGFLPPLSGAVNNAKWKNSNGAWIRTEIWACSFPAMPETAIKMAFEDASVDHGYGEGTFAAIFVAAMESAAFVSSDINNLLDIGLSKIPDSCRVSKSVRLVMDCYKKGMDWKDARNAVVEDSKDLGWFQAPANVAFVVLGLLYGECDFKKSMLYAVNCGDDTDCTAATVGALLGIMYGSAGIPKDWEEHIGDEIKTICIRQNIHYFPSSCTELTDRVMQLLPVTLNALTPFHKKYAFPEVVLTDGKTDLSELDEKKWMGSAFADTIKNRSQYALTDENVFMEVIVEFDKEPVIKPLDTVSGKITVINKKNFPDQRRCEIKWYLPEGFTVDCTKNLICSNKVDGNPGSCTFAITAGETVEAVNDILLKVACPHRPTPVIIPVHIIG